jgi:hypothetical protein
MQYLEKKYLKQATLWAVGMVMINAKRSSMNVLNALYMNALLKPEDELILKFYLVIVENIF